MSNVPKLRFPEFEGGWKKKKLGEITKKTGEKYKNQKEYGVYSISNKYGFILQEEQFEGGRLGGLDKALYQIVNSGEFAYNPARINVGSIALLENEVSGIVSSLYVCFKLIPEIDNLFFKQYINTYVFRVSVLRNTEGSVREYLFYDNLSNITMFCPDAGEQTQIANFLALLDKKIIKQDEKVAALEQYKKGLTHKIFSREIRFKNDDGNDYPEWGKRKLGLLCEVFTDGDWIETKDQSDTGMRLIQTGNIGIGIYHNKPDNARYISIDSFKKLRCKEVYPGDILVSRLPAPAGRACILPDNIDNRLITAVDCTIIRVNKSCLASFLLQYMCSDQYFKEISKDTAGSTRIRISRNNLEVINIPTASLPEQTKIANFLTLYDRKIEKEKAKLEALKVQKKGLLQQMFV